MTWALCVYCGEVKSGALCHCPKCDATSTGNMNVDAAFSDHRLTRETLERLGEVVRSIRETTSDRDLRYWAFIHYVSQNHGEILRVDLEPEMRYQVEAILSGAHLPEVTICQSETGARSNARFDNP